MALEVYDHEIRESAQEQIRKLKELGTVKEIVRSKSLLLLILTYSGDRHLIGFFCDLLNEAIENKEIVPEDLELLRNGWLGDCTIKLKEILVANNIRQPYTWEVGDKLNYLTCIKDTETQIATFTNPIFIEALAEIKPNNELTYCEQSFGMLDIETQLRIAEAVLKAGNLEVGTKILTNATRSLEFNRKENERLIVEATRR